MYVRMFVCMYVLYIYRRMQQDADETFEKRSPAFCITLHMYARIIAGRGSVALTGCVCALYVCMLTD